MPCDTHDQQTHGQTPIFLDLHGEMEIVWLLFRFIHIYKYICLVWRLCMEEFRSAVYLFWLQRECERERERNGIGSDSVASLYYAKHPELLMWRQTPCNNMLSLSIFRFYFGCINIFLYSHSCCFELTCNTTLCLWIEKQHQISNLQMLTRMS